MKTCNTKGDIHKTTLSSRNRVKLLPIKASRTQSQEFNDTCKTIIQKKRKKYYQIIYIIGCYYIQKQKHMMWKYRR